MYNLRIQLLHLQHITHTFQFIIISLFITTSYPRQRFTVMPEKRRGFTVDQWCRWGCQEGVFGGRRDHPTSDPALSVRLTSSLNSSMLVGGPSFVTVLPLPSADPGGSWRPGGGALNTWPPLLLRRLTCHAMCEGGSVRVRKGQRVGRWLYVPLCRHLPLPPPPGRQGFWLTNWIHGVFPQPCEARAMRPSRPHPSHPYRTPVNPHRSPP